MGDLAAPTSDPRIATIDLSPYLDPSSSTSSRKAVANALAAACSAQGCVAIRNHGWPASKLRGLLEMSQKLFNLPLAEKMKAPHPTDSYSPHRGYSPVGNEKCYSHDELTDGSEVKRKIGRRIVDYKECYEVGSEANDYDHNIWLPEDVLPGFKSLTLKAFWELHSVCISILDALLLGIGMSDEDRKAVISIHSGLNDQLRLLHYPSIPAGNVDDELLGRMPAHADFSTFTLLFQDSCGGLEFKDMMNNSKTADAEFMSATPDEGVLYLNVGEMLTRLTNDYLPSAIHRVTIPNKRIEANGSLMTPPRFSIPFFFMPDPMAPIAPVESMVKDGKHYEPVTNREYGEWKSRWTYKK